jgi:dephospho-CoA kinase
MRQALPVIGIVGGIGSGKSVVAEAMRRRGGYLISGDQLGHEALHQPDIRAKIVQRWGDKVLNPQGEIDRRQVAAIVFADANERRALEALVFPHIERRIHEEVAAAGAKPDIKFIILDAAILLETGWHANCSRIVFVDGPGAVRLARLKEKRGWSEEEVIRRESAQWPVEVKQSRADAVIVNDEGLEKVDRQVQAALEQWNLIC